MANFNGAPTGDNSANNGDYTPESFSDTDNTAQLPKLNENVDSHNDNNTSDIQPAADPEQNVADGNNTERKSHLGRNLVIGGVAVALAFSAWAFSQNGDTAKPTSDADSKPVITEGYDNEQNYVNNEQTEPVITQPETEPTSNNGLTVDELVHELYPSSSISEAMSSDPLEVSETICDWLITDGGYSTIGAGNSGIAYQNAVGTYIAVMRDMGVGHEKGIASDFCNAFATGLCSSVDGSAFPYGHIVTEFHV